MTAPVQLRVPGSDGKELAVYRWEPQGAPRGVVEIVHGMGEHIQRGGYLRLAEACVAAGYAVQAHDDRGSGQSVASLDEQGQIGADGWQHLVDDIGVLIAKAHEWYPDVPVVLFAHSMGSFAAQQWVLDHSAEISGLVLSGTALLDIIEQAIDLSQGLDLSMFNAPFENRTGFEWLSRDPHEVDLYVEDPRCGFGLDDAAGGAMFATGRAVADPERLAKIRPDLPVLIEVGENDPVNAGLVAVTPIVDRLQGAGVKDVTLKTWPGSRHEILNETNHDEVVADIVGWIQRVTG